jgi:PAS domain S-box-containing protein
LFDDSGVMRFVAWRGLSEDYRRALEGHSPWTLVTKDPQPIWIEDAANAGIPEPLKAALEREGIGALAFVPLVVGGKLVGKFMTYCDGPRVFSEGDIDLSVTIARQLGFSLERMVAEESHRRAVQEARLLGAIVQESDDAIISRDLSGIITSWNRGAERLFGYRPEEVLGKSITMLMPSDHQNEEPANLERIRRGERVDHYETVRMHKDGSLIDISLSLSPIKDASGRIIGASKIARDIRERKRAQARQELLTQEIHHRTKNIFSVVQAVVSRSFAGKRTVAEAESSVLSRLQSLAQTHQILVEKEWQGAELADVIRRELRPYQGRVTIEGPRIALNARATQDFALAVHELATNAAKYGALSNATGQLQIGWSIGGPASAQRFSFRWQEQGGPPVAPPTSKGFGSTVLEHVMAAYSEHPSRIEFAPSGVIYELRSPLGALTE